MDVLAGQPTTPTSPATGRLSAFLIQLCGIGADAVWGVAGRTGAEVRTPAPAPGFCGGAPGRAHDCAWNGATAPPLGFG